MSTTLRVTMVSESEFGVQGQGVHTAHRELVDALDRRDDVEVNVNTWRRPADITHIQTVGPYSLWYLLFGKGKKVVSAHVVPASFVGSLAGAKYWLPLARLYLKWFYGRADCVFAVSNMVRDELVNDMGLSNRIEVTYNTVDMAKYRPDRKGRQAARQKLGIAEDQFMVLGIGQVQPRKRVDVFIDTAKQSEALFVWVGGIPFKRMGADFDAMQRLLETDQPNVRMTGIIDHVEVADYTAAADAFYLPAEQENHPMCVLEAAGAGLPIILNDIREYDDTFRPDAIFVTSAEQAAQAVNRLAADDDYRSEIAAKSRAISKRFDSSSGARRAVDIYRSLLGKMV